MFWLGFSLFVFFCASLPVYRFIGKRISFFLRLRRICRVKNFHLIPLHRFWIFPLRCGDTFDFAIETRDDAYAVKFFGVWRKHDEVRFGPDAVYCIRHYLGFLSRFGEAVLLTLWDSPEKPLPVYRYPHEITESFGAKLWKPFLLMHPVGYSIRLMDARGSSVQICSGDRAGRYQITSAFQFLETLQCAPEIENRRT